ncbi:protein translocase subunit SecF [Glutamicibacter sp. MNS18]|uniref:protein translocase subunit SecF n=1 Tax=Glutamicibacter sp. MNS18 TaxID=2989817 RepID=UPI00223577AF|nr:protein translocase subunit SecF [Glutamicibacter sp. MNS18]MCW4464772.1 protein translocase subunit SecF [Glutamicibacter sp. MNS18]
MNKLAQWGNELYTGKRSYPFVPKRKLWFSIAAVLLLLSILVPVVKGGFNLGIDFRGGSEFTVSAVANTDVSLGETAVATAVPGQEATVTNIAPNTMRIQTERLDDDQTLSIAAELAAAYEVGTDQVTSTFIGPTWGQDVSRQALVGLVAFVVLVTLLMAAYFRTWKMSAAAVIGLMTVIVITMGIYGLSGFEITPSAIIGFLTIMSYCLYDTVVVFDKIRENTANFIENEDRTFNELVNLAVNQTLVRSINTSVVAVLPVAAILFIGSYLLGAGTLKDLSLALFIGLIISALSTLFVQAPMYSWLRRNEPDVVAQRERLLAKR